MRISVDIGTSMTKAVLYDDALVPVAVRSQQTQMQRPGPGRYEHDLRSIVDGVLHLIVELPGDDVNLVTITGQGDGLWLLDAEDGAAGPAVSWMDSRGTPECDLWFSTGVAEAIFRRLGNTPFPGAGSALLAAEERTEPERLARAATATQCQHAVLEVLTGSRAATRSAAMLGVFDPVAGGYDQEALRLTGLDRHRRLLPDICSEAVATAPIRPDLAERAGLPADTTVASGPYDLPAAALGAGVTAPGDGLLIVGTTLACLVLHDEVVPAGEPAGLTLRAADDRGYLRAMPAMVGTAGLDWVLALVGATHGELDALLATSRPGAGGVGALPYLSPAGERAPFTDPHARGQLTGLSLATTPADLVRAYCEALGYAARHCFEAAGLTGSITICGGGSAGTSLVGLFADILDRPVAVAQEREVTARGAVLAALSDSPRGQPAAVTMVDPRRVNAAAYREGYHAYLDRGAAARLDAWWAPGDRHMTCTEKAKSATGAPAATPACGPR